jgi:hypothetical protein
MALTFTEPTELPEPSALPEPCDVPEPSALPEPIAIGGHAFEEPGELVIEGDPERQLAVQRDSIVTRAKAMTVTNAQSYAGALQFAIDVDAMLQAAKAYWDPRVALAHAPWKKACDDRAAFLKPLEEARSILTTAARTWKVAEDARARQDADRKQREADEAAAKERARLQAEAQAAAKAGHVEQATDLVEQARQVEAPIIRPDPVAPKVAGVADKSNWSYEMLDKKQFVDAVSGLDRVKAEIERHLNALHRDNRNAERTVLESLLNYVHTVTPTISLEAVVENAVYMRQRAKADKNTLRWPGVRFYDAGSTAIRTARGRRS